MPVETIVKLHPVSLAHLEALLSQNHLPTQDCVEQMQNFYGMFAGDELIAAGGLEPAEDYALLRSVVVKTQYRAMGLAQKIVGYLLDLAESENRLAVYLLTETAGSYFQKLGFKPVPRKEVPEMIRQTRQFSTLCPDSASCFVMRLPR